MAYGQNLSWVMRKNNGESVVMQLLFLILVDQSENYEKKNWRFGLKGAAVADSGWDEVDWESIRTERRFDLGKEDGGGDLINDDCDKYDDHDCDDCGDNRSWMLQ